MVSERNTTYHSGVTTKLVLYGEEEQRLKRLSHTLPKTKAFVALQLLSLHISGLTWKKRRRNGFKIFVIS